MLKKGSIDENCSKKKFCSFRVFKREIAEQTKREFPNMRNHERSMIIKEKWKKLNNHERGMFVHKSRLEEEKDYFRQIKDYY